MHKSLHKSLHKPLRKPLRKTVKRNNKAGNRFLESKVHIANMFNGSQRDVTNMVLRDYAASRIQKSRQTMVTKRNFELGLANFYNNLTRFITVLRRLNPTQTTLTAIKDDILRTMPDRTVAGFLRLPNLYGEINRLNNLLTNHFPPVNKTEKHELIELVDLIIQTMNEPLHDRIAVPLLPYRQFRGYQAQEQAQGEGVKRKTRRIKAYKSV
jgi:hypothetical protein